MAVQSRSQVALVVPYPSGAGRAGEKGQAAGQLAGSLTDQTAVSVAVKSSAGAALARMWAPIATLIHPEAILVVASHLPS